MSELYRTFIAIEVPPEIRAQVIQHIERLREAVPEVRASWSREDNLHLTLKFFGNTPVDRISAISAGVTKAAATMQPFELVVSGSGAFPPRGRPSVLWIGIEDPAGQLAILHRAIESECAALGFAKEARAYHPHLTVARLRQPQQSRPLASAHQNLSFSKRPFTISEVVLFRSELLKQGSRHTALSRHKLG